MKAALFVRPLSPEDRQALRDGLRSPWAFTLRRSQILLASDEGLKASQIRARLGCATQTAMAPLKALPPGRVAAFVDQGPAVLLHTRHGVIPGPYHRDAAGIPHRWLATVKESIRSVAPRFSARRMVKEYVEHMYMPALTARAEVKP